MINWDNLMRIKIDNNIKKIKYEIVKIILILKLLERHNKEKDFIRIYTEFDLTEKLKCDVYYENMVTKEVYVFILTDGKKRKIEQLEFENWNPYLIKYKEIIMIDLNSLSDDIYIINKEISKFIR